MSNTNIKAGSVATFNIKVNGSEISDTTLVHSIEINQSVNSISSAEITILDGDVTKGKFEHSSSKVFVPGNKVRIEAGYDSKNFKVYEGIITKQNIEINREGAWLKIKCNDEAVKMTVGRKCQTYHNKSDSDIINSIITNYSKLSASIESTATIWPEQVQYYSTDWDFIIARAQANGLITTNINGKIAVANYDDETSPILEIKYGNNLIEFNAELNAVSQLGSVKAASWDYTTQKTITGQATSKISGAGNLTSKKLSEVVGLKSYNIQTPANLDKQDLTTWSKSQILKTEYAKIKGNVKIQGTELTLPGKFIKLSAVGDRFNGDHFVSSVRHTIANGDWRTTLSLGLSSEWYTENTNVMAPPAAGLLPGVRGLFNATVKKNYGDPDNQYRILVDIPLFDSKGEGIWARLSNFYATSGAGAFFIPEVGDEVILGFLNEDPRYPIILGSLYSNSKNKPPLIPNELNSIKAIVSKSKITIEFDDENKIMTISTPSKNTIVLDDKSKEISISDLHSNKLVMSASGISLKSPKNVSIEAGEEVKLKGKEGIIIESSAADVNIKGVNITSKAKVKSSVSAGASALVDGGAELGLRGAIVMIN